MTRGFTLIETVIYFALLSLIIACSFQLFSSMGDFAASATAAATAASEGEFAAHKIEYAFGHDPDAEVTLDDGTLVLAEDGETLPLTSANVSVSALEVTVLPGGGREASFFVNGVAFTALAAP
jgi:type II secretory pathway pseudopilin PulG